MQNRLTLKSMINSTTFKVRLFRQPSDIHHQSYLTFQLFFIHRVFFKMVLESITINWIWIYDMDAYSKLFLLDKCLIVIYEFGYSTIFDESVISQGVDNKSCVQNRKELKEGLVFLLLKCCHMKSQGQASFSTLFLWE